MTGETEKIGLLAPILRSLRVTARRLTLTVLCLGAVWMFLVGIANHSVIQAQAEYPVVSADAPVPRPIVVATIPLPLPSPLNQADIAINPITGYAYVLARAHSPYPPVQASLVTVSEAQVISTSISANYRGALAVNPDLSQVYMPIDGGMAVISGTEVVEVVPVDRTLTGRSIGVEPSSHYIYVDGYDWYTMCIPETSWCGGIVWVLKDGWSTRRNVGGRVEAIGVNPVTGFVYATYRNSGLWDIRRTAVIHGVENIADIPSYGEAIGINPDTGYVYITDADLRRVYVLKATQIVETLTPGLEPGAVGINPHTGYVYISNTGSNSVTVISATQVITTLRVGLAPGPIGVNPESGYVYVANTGDATLSVISGTQVIWTLPAGHTPGAVGVNSDDGYVYVVNYEDATISVIREMILPHRIYLPLVVKP